MEHRGEQRIIGNVPISDASQEKVLASIEERLKKNQKTKIFFLNAHCFNVAQKDPIYLKNLQRADFILNDGIGVELGAKIFGIALKDNLNGTDFTPEVLSLAAANKMSVFLIGGEPGIALRASEKMTQTHQGIRIAGTSDGFFSETAHLLEEIRSAQPDLLIVGLGVPLQEKWISDHFEELDASVIMAVGAFLDFTAGKVSRAPLLFRKLRLEWLFRLVLEPKRLWKRYLIGNLLFFWHITKLKFQTGLLLSKNIK